MDRPLKVTSPPTAAAVKAPERVPPAGLVPMAKVMESVAVMTWFPLASCTCTLIAGEITSVETASVGSILKTSLLASPAVMLKGADVAELKPATLAMRV